MREQREKENARNSRRRSATVLMPPLFFLPNRNSIHPVSQLFVLFHNPFFFIILGYQRAGRIQKYLSYALSSGPRHLSLAWPSCRLPGEGEPGGGFRGGTTGVSLSRLSPTFLVAHGRRGERTRARFCGVAAPRRARESSERREGRGCSQSVPKTFTIARLGSLALALSLGLCLMAYLPM